jgi:hypothetical protein
VEVKNRVDDPVDPKIVAEPTKSVHGVPRGQQRGWDEAGGSAPLRAITDP